MATTQSQRPRKSAQQGPDPASRGLILVIVAVALGTLLLITGGAVGFDKDQNKVDIGSDKPTTTEATASSITEAPPVTVAPADVKVVVANGAGIGGLAGRGTEFLATQGYSGSVATDAAAAATTTAVYYAAGFEGNARAIAELLGVPSDQVKPLPAGAPLAKDQPADAAVVVVLGPDADAKLNAPTTTVAAGGTTVTTAPG